MRWSRALIAGEPAERVGRGVLVLQADVPVVSAGGRGREPVGQRERAGAGLTAARVVGDLDVAEVGGAVKIVLAIACGVVEGLQLGQNARAALIARGYAEMQRFGEALGAQRATIAGLCGLGDLVLTCSSTAGRNFSLGKAIGEGRDAAALMADRRTVAEGAHTAPVLHRIASERGIDMPIVGAVAALLQGTTPIDEVLEQLMARPPRPEAH